jgi:hypothetical protein
VYLQRRIDKAFDQQNSNPNAVGPSDSGGGFLVESDSQSAEDISQISLSAIPAALQLLDLPPDDEQVLLVFRNAAAGWKSSTNRPEEIGVEDAAAQDLFVSRDDWRSVCAVLLEHHAEEYEDMSDSAPVGHDGIDDEDSDEYRDPEDDKSDASSSADEYTEESPSAARRKRTTKRRRSASSSASSSVSLSTPKKLTARQTKSCLETFALFFPDAPESKLPEQRIMIKDIQRLSKLIGDRLKTEDVRVFGFLFPTTYF